MIGVSVMQKYLCILAVIGCVLIAGSGSAKVYWLPDYLQENLDRNSDRVNDINNGGGGGGHDGSRACPSGWISEAEKGGWECAQKMSLPNIGFCYSGCVDPCSGLVDNDCGVFGCSQHYAKCSAKCETCYTDNCRNRTDNITNNEWGCQQYWADCATKCEIPNSDNCTNRQDNLINAEWGCQQYWSDCESKCEVPYSDNCRNRTDNKTDYGCEKYWQDCSTKCEVGKICTPTDCSSFTLTTAPANASYEECSPGCGNTTKRYKFTRCNLGYYDKKSFVCPTARICTWSTK